MDGFGVLVMLMDDIEFVLENMVWGVLEGSVVVFFEMVFLGGL